MSETPKRKPRKKSQSFLLGLGLDGKDGHRRITHGPGFHLEGGSEETHQRLQETVFTIAETLEREGRSILETSPKVLANLIRKGKKR